MLSPLKNKQKPNRNAQTYKKCYALKKKIEVVVSDYLEVNKTLLHPMSGLLSVHSSEAIQVPSDVPVLVESPQRVTPSALGEGRAWQKVFLGSFSCGLYLIRCLPRFLFTMVYLKMEINERH